MLSVFCHPPKIRRHHGLCRSSLHTFSLKLRPQLCDLARLVPDRLCQFTNSGARIDLSCCTRRQRVSKVTEIPEPVCKPPRCLNKLPIRLNSLLL